MTYLLQPIDAVLGRPVRIAIGNFLDEWIMDAENMEWWEPKLTDSDRCILITKFVAKAITFMINYNNDDIRVVWFFHTGYLVTMLPNGKYNVQISLQGMTLGIFSIPKEFQNDTDEGDNVVNVNTGP